MQGKAPCEILPCLRDAFEEGSTAVLFDDPELKQTALNNLFFVTFLHGAYRDQYSSRHEHRFNATRMECLRKYQCFIKVILLIVAYLSLCIVGHDVDSKRK